MKDHLTILLTAAALVSGGASARAQSAWLPDAGEIILTPGFSFSTFDEFRVGETLVAPLKANDESLDQYTGYIELEYGILDDLAADLSLGYTWTSGTRTLGPGDDGMADTLFGVTYRFVEEGDTIPAIAFRLGGILAGTYDEGTPFSAGDGANGLETSLLFGKSFGDSGFGLYGDVGYRVRDNPVPNEWFTSAGAFKQFGGIFHVDDGLTFNVGYSYVGSENGLDIGGPGFDPSRGIDHGFPALKEVNHLIEAVIGYTDAGGRLYQFSAARSLDGRNTGDKLIFGLSVSVPF